MKNRTRLKIRKTAGTNALLIVVIVTAVIACMIGITVGTGKKPISSLMAWIHDDESADTKSEDPYFDPDDPDFTDPQQTDTDADETDENETDAEETDIYETKPAESQNPAESEAPQTRPISTDPDVVARRNDPNYYNDVLFIGDSRTVGLYGYGKIDGAKYYAKTSMSVFNALKITESETGPKVTLQNYLSKNKFGKIYILLGINEIGYPVDNIVKKFSSLISEIQKLQPDSIIVIQSNMNVTKAKSDNNPDTFNNSRINELNTKLSKLADDETVYFINFAPLFNDGNGCMVSDYTGDGVHLKAKYYTIWKEYLLSDGKC